MDIGKLKTDPDKEKGTWVSLDTTSSILVSYTGSREYRKALRARLKPYSNVMAGGKALADTIPDGEIEALGVAILADKVLLDWKGIKVDGVDVPYSKEKAKELFQEIPAFREMVETIAGDLANFRAETDQAEEKNSETASAGS